MYNISMIKKIILRLFRKYIINDFLIDKFSDSPYSFRGKFTFCYKIFEGYYLCSSSLAAFLQVKFSRAEELLHPQEKINFYSYLVPDEKKKALTMDFYKMKDKKWQFTTNILLLKDNGYTDEEIINTHLKHTIPIEEYEIKNGFLNFNYSKEDVNDARHTIFNQISS